MAVICGDESLTWAQLEQRTNKVANALFAAGIRKGDKVCLLMRNSLIAFELFWGIVRSGAVLVALNTLVSGEALARLINNSDGRLLFADKIADDRAGSRFIAKTVPRGYQSGRLSRRVAFRRANDRGR